MENLTVLLKLLISKQSYLIYLAGVMIVSGLIKEHGLFAGLYGALHRRIKSKRLLIILSSTLCGVLPVPGRVTVSAGILSTMASDRESSRSKFGLIDYLATHHYYIWSPLEKTIIIPMAVLGLSYGQILGYTAPLLVISLAYIAWYIFSKIKEEDIQLAVLSPEAEPFSLKDFALRPLPLLSGIIALVLGAPPSPVFVGLTVYYVFSTGAWREPAKLLHHINFKLLLFVALIIGAGSVIKQGETAIRDFLETSSLSMANPMGALLICCFAFGSAFILGSSSKFAGLVALLASVYGVEYLTLFFALEYSGYLISPFHKCVAIGKMYFNTPLRTYVRTLAVWCGVMILYATIFTFTAEARRNLVTHKSNTIDSIGD